MELIDQIHALENEIKLVKGEIKKVLVDLREAMNTAENPFAYLEQFQQAGGSVVDEERLRQLEERVGHFVQADDRLKQLEERMEQVMQSDERLRQLEERMEQVMQSDERLRQLEERMEQVMQSDERLRQLEERMEQVMQSDERLRQLEERMEQFVQGDERLRQLEAAAERLKQLSAGKGFAGEERLKKVEDDINQLAEIVSNIYEEKVKHLEDAVQELKEQRNGAVSNLKRVEPAVEMVTGPESVSEGMLIRRPRTESELNEFGIILRDEYGNEVIDAITLAQLIQWADTTVNLIGMEKLSQVVDLLELTGRISKETKDIISKIAKLPEIVQVPEKEHVDAKHCIVALFELNRILTGRYPELSMLLKDTMWRTLNAH